MKNLNEDDIEPIKLIENRCILSRYHYDLITLWTDYDKIDKKPKITFGLKWHTPIAYSDIQPQLLLSGNIKLRDKVRISLLFGGFLTMSITTCSIGFKEKKSYSHLIKEKNIDERILLSTEKIIAVAHFGNVNDIPESLKEKIESL